MTDLGSRPSPAALSVEPVRHELTGLADASPWRRILAWTIFPATFAASMAITKLGLDQGLESFLAVLPGVAVGLAVVAIAERIQPHSPRWSRSHNDVGTDLLHMTFSQVLPPPVIDLGVALAVSGLGIAVAEQLGRAAWPVEWGFWWQVALAAIVGELGQYVWHRLCHEHPWFWRFHALHHSAPRLWWLNAGRFHPLDTAIAYTATITPLVVLGCPPGVLAAMATFAAVHGMFQHANIDLRLGPLNWVFSMAELHRWHHSKDLRYANANYGANVIFWDVVFGTRVLPHGKEHDPADVGFDGDQAFPQTFIAQLGTPFRWRRLEAAMAAAERAVVEPSPQGPTEDGAT